MDHPLPARTIPPASLLKAARRLLRPLVRLMMRSGLTFPVLADTLRGLFVDVAINDMLADPKSRTDSRISLLTGLHRKEIRRLRESAGGSDQAPEIVTLISQIVGRWAGSAAFTDADGRPRPLSRSIQPEAADLPLFDTLIASITTDVRPRAVLDDLLAHGVVHVDSADRVQLNTDAFIPRPGGEEQLFYFARNLHDHMAAAAANISAGDVAPFLDRSVHYDRLTPAEARTLQDYAQVVAHRALSDVNRRAREIAGPGVGEPCADQRRINFGIYIFGEPDLEPEGDA
jgi:hypothetical protein